MEMPKKNTRCFKQKLSIYKNHRSLFFFLKPWSPYRKFCFDSQTVWPVCGHYETSMVLPGKQKKTNTESLTAISKVSHTWYSNKFLTKTSWLAARRPENAIWMPKEQLSQKSTCTSALLLSLLFWIQKIMTLKKKIR